MPEGKAITITTELKRILPNAVFKSRSSHADDKFKLVESGRELSKQVENTVEKGEIALYEQFLLFPQCFQKTGTTDT